VLVSLGHAPARSRHLAYYEEQVGRLTVEIEAAEENLSDANRNHLDVKGGS
jgi:hypothetical protein